MLLLVGKQASSLAMQGWSMYVAVQENYSHELVPFKCMRDY